MATAKQVISGLYAAFFSRGADIEGLNYWTDQAGGGNSQEIFNTLAAGFSTHPKFSEIYDSMTDKQFVEAIYVNVLGFEGDAEGIQYWEESIVNGSSRSSMVSVFVYSALNINLNDAQWDSLTSEERSTAQLRQDTLFNKADIGIYFAEQLGLASSVFKADDLDNDRAYLNSISALAGVNNTEASVLAAKALIDNIKAIEPIIDLSNATQQAIDGVAELFIYQIDTSNYIIESRESNDITLDGFNVAEDRIIFQDTPMGTTSTANFMNEAFIFSSTETIVTYDKAIINNDSVVVAEEGFTLTLAGITDFTAIDYLVI